MAKGRDSGMPPVKLWESFFGSPADLFDALGCQSVRGDAVEFGCGYGTFTVALAPRVSGTLYALDIDPTMVGATSARSAHVGACNIIVEQRDFVTAGSGRPEGSVSLVMLFNILHIEDPLDLLCEAHRILRDDGVATVIHWKHDIQTPRGPPIAIRPSPEQCRDWAERTGFRCLRVSRQLPNSPWHWGMLLQKNVPCS
ncbi:MAG: class I SAM-dependent methyltransferase [Pseudomonadota bacterium]|nr:class I SAM-dependent methyltransferase [Pseudomonadota bacterium]